MAKAIPVFKFAFAAYAASGLGAMRELREAKARRSGQQTRFLKTWSVFSTDGGLRVKIGVRDGERCEAVLEPRETGEDYREIWLGEICQTANAFSGVVRGRVPLCNLRPGQRIGFDPTHILDWSIGCALGEDCGPDCEGKALCETVGS